MKRLSEMPYRSPLDETAAVGMGNEGRFGTEESELQQGFETVSWGRGSNGGQ
jgi:hypothetical protein